MTKKQIDYKKQLENLRDIMGNFFADKTLGNAFTEFEKGQESVKRYIQEQEGKKVFDYDIFECPEELKGQLKIGDFYG